LAVTAMLLLQQFSGSLDGGIISRIRKHANLSQNAYCLQIEATGRSIAYVQRVIEPLSRSDRESVGGGQGKKRAAVVSLETGRAARGVWNRKMDGPHLAGRWESLSKRNRNLQAFQLGAR
jgi:hypothetical protein